MRRIYDDDLQLIMRHDTEDRLATTCFRGRHVYRAGNFFEWESVHQMVSNHEVKQQFLDDIRRRLPTTGRDNVFTGICRKPIGWVTTALVPPADTNS